MRTYQAEAHATGTANGEPVEIVLVCEHQHPWRRQAARCARRQQAKVTAKVSMPLTWTRTAIADTGERYAL